MTSRKWLLLVCSVTIVFSGFACGKRGESVVRKRTQVITPDALPQNPSVITHKLKYKWTSNAVQCTSGIFCFTCGNGSDLFVGCKEGTVSSSTDGGKRWKISNVARKHCFVNSLICLKDAVYAGTGRGVYRSTDNGSCWNAVNTGLAELGVTCLSKDLNGALYAGTGSGVFRSVDGGNHWKRVSSGLADRSSYFDSLVLDSHGRIFAFSQGGGLYVSGNKVWEHLDFRHLRGSIACICIDSKDRLYVGIEASEIRDDRPEWTNEAPMMRSDDGGKHWKSLRICKDNVSCESLAIMPDGTLLAGTDAGIFASCDHGEHWQPLSVDERLLGQPAWASDQSGIVSCSEDGYIYMLNEDERNLQCGIPVK